MKKLAIYLRECPKPIILSDANTDSFDDVVKQCENIFRSNKVFAIKTNNDCLIGRPSEVQAILVSIENRPPQQQYRR